MLPAIEYGYYGYTGRVLIAYGVLVGALRWIGLGFLTRLPSGQWTFTDTGGLAPSSQTADRSCKNFFYDRFSAAFNRVRGEWGVTWMCNDTGDIRSYFGLVDWSGDGVASLPFMVHDLVSDAEHTGPSLAFNKFSQAYLVGLQHNLAHVDVAGGTPYCARSGGNCVEYRTHHTGMQSHWAIEADYFGGLEFRASADCLQGCSQGIGMLISEELQLGGMTWFFEPDSIYSPGVVAPVRSDGWNETHAYVRVPPRGQTVILHNWERPSGSIGNVRFSVVDELSSVPFYD